MTKTKTTNNQFICFIFFVVRGIFRNVFRLTDDEYSVIEGYINENKNDNQKEINKIIQKIKDHFCLYINYLIKQNKNNISVLNKLKESINSDNWKFLIHALLLFFKSNVRNSLVHNARNGKKLLSCSNNKNKENIEKALNDNFLKYFPEIEKNIPNIPFEKKLFYYYSLFIRKEIINDYLNDLSEMELNNQKIYAYVKKYCLEKNLFNLNIRPYIFNTEIKNLKKWDHKYHYCNILLDRLKDDYKSYKKTLLEIEKCQNKDDKFLNLKKEIKFLKNQIYITIMYIFEIHMNKYNDENKDSIELKFSVNKKYIYGVKEEVKKFQITFSNIGYYYSKNKKDIFEYDDFKKFINEFKKNKNRNSNINKLCKKLTFEDRYLGIEGRRKKIHNNFLWLLKFITKLINKDEFKKNKIIQFVYGYKQLYKDDENNNNEEIKELKNYIKKKKIEINKDNNNKKISIGDEIKYIYERIETEKPDKKEILCKKGESYLNKKDNLKQTNKNKNPQPNFLFLFSKSDYQNMLIDVFKEKKFSDQVEKFLNYSLERFIQKVKVKDVIHLDKLKKCLNVFNDKDEENKIEKFWKLFYKEFLNDWNNDIEPKQNKIKKINDTKTKRSLETKFEFVNNFIKNEKNEKIDYKILFFDSSLLTKIDECDKDYSIDNFLDAFGKLIIELEDKKNENKVIRKIRNFIVHSGCSDNDNYNHWKKCITLPKINEKDKENLWINLVFELLLDIIKNPESENRQFLNEIKWKHNSN